MLVSAMTVSSAPSTMLNGLEKKNPTMAIANPMNNATSNDTPNRRSKDSLEAVCFIIAYFVAPPIPIINPNPLTRLNIGNARLRAVRPLAPSPFAMK